MIVGDEAPHRGITQCDQTQNSPASSGASSGDATSDDSLHASAMPASWERLRFINSEIQIMLHLLAAGDSLRPGVASPELIAVLLNYLGEVDGLRRSGQLDEVSSCSQAIWRDYRATLERMNRVIPKLEQQLQSDRSRLAQEQKQLSGASAWTSTTKLTR